MAPGKPFRLVIVGIDTGANYEEKKLEGFIESQKGIEKWYYGTETGTETKFNPYYREESSGRLRPFLDGMENTALNTATKNQNAWGVGVPTGNDASSGHLCSQIW